MGRRNNGIKFRKSDYFWMSVLFPIALVCAYPILLVIIGALVILYIIVDAYIFFSERNKRKELFKTVPVKNETPLQVKNEIPIPNVYFNNDLFEPQIINRGIEYYRNKKIIQFEKNNNKCRSLIEGTNNYAVELSFDRKQNLKAAYCTCPYNAKGLLCKHIYATMLKYFEIESSKQQPNQNNKFTLSEEIIEMCSEMEEELENAKDQYNRLNVNSEEITSLYEELLMFEDLIDEYKSLKLGELTQEIYEEICDKYDEFNEILVDVVFMLDDYEFGDDSQDEEDITVGEAMALGAAAYGLYDHYQSEKEEQEYQEKKEELKYTWGLTDYQAELVMSGEYESCQFSEESEIYDEDDHHYEDE